MLLSNLDVLATAPGGVARLRELILTLAVQGKLVSQDSTDEPAGVLLQKIRAEKDRLIAEGKIKRDKPLAAIAEDEKPFELPQGWEWVRLGDICAYIQRGKGPVYAESSEHRVVSQKCVRWHGLDLAPARFVTPESLAKYEPIRFLQAGDLLWNSTGTGTIGRACLVPFEHENAGLVADSHVTVVRPVQISSGFLWRWIQSPYVLSEIEGSASGTTNQIELNTSTVVNHLVPLPPLAEQPRIVTRVEALMRLCDALEAKGQLEAAQHAQLVSTLLSTLTASTTPEELADNWQRVAQHFDLLLDRPEAIDALEQTLLQLAVRGMLVPQDRTDEPASALLQKIRAEKDRLIAAGQIKRDKPLPPITDEEQPFELPVGWEWVRMGEAFDGGSGTTPLRTRTDFFLGGTEMWVKTTDLTNSLVTTCEELITKGAVEENRLRYFPSGTVCVAMYGGAGTIGKSGILGVSATINQSVFALPPMAGMNKDFLHTYVITVRPRWMSFAAGLRKDPNINGQIIKKMVMPVPPSAEQSRIVARVTALRRLCADLRQRLADAQTTQSHLAQTLVNSTSFV